MIKFFRNSRQNLILEKLPNQKTSKTSKYLKYAIGEIVLVVIGILVALQINDYNDQLKLDKREQSYLKRLVLENKKDLLTFNAEIERLRSNNQKTINLSNAFKDKDCSNSLLVQSAIEYVIDGSLYPLFNPSTSTFDDLSTTGNLNVIKSTQLRDKIVGHYEEYQSVESNFQLDNNWATPIDASLWSQTDAIRFDTNLTSFLFPDDSMENLAQELRREQSIYMRNAALHYWINEHCIKYLEETKEKTSAFIAVLEAATRSNN